MLCPEDVIEDGSDGFPTSAQFGPREAIPPATIEFSMSYVVPAKPKMLPPRGSVPPPFAVLPLIVDDLTVNAVSCDEIPPPTPSLGGSPETLPVTVLLVMVTVAKNVSMPPPLPFLVAWLPVMVLLMMVSVPASSSIPAPPEPVPIPVVVLSRIVQSDTVRATLR